MNRNLVIIIALPIVTILLGYSINEFRAESTAASVAVHHIQYSLNTPQLFITADNCMNCHNNLVTPAGEDISIGIDWRASMMANSGRDPYWHAAVRREVMDHPESRAAIEDECSTCHMPMSHYQALHEGRLAKVFANLPANRAQTLQQKMAVDGVSCTTCHQITSENFGEKESFVGNFKIDSVTAMGERSIYGPYPVDQGLSTIMHSSSGFRQVESKHLIQSELCATCHTLYTHTLGPEGEVIGEFPEQVPYLEWRHSGFVDRQSCQSCHMPTVEESTPISNVLGEPRAEVNRHSFRGANFFMIRMLNRYRDELGVKALPQEMNNAVNRTIDHLQQKSAKLYIHDAGFTEKELRIDLVVENLAGHKLPTAYPSRRSWIHLKVTDQDQNVLYESGAIRPDGSIEGNDNDIDKDRFEPHYAELTSESQVQIYEAILEDTDGNVTTGLLNAIRYSKDNRLLPDGFEKKTAGPDIAVHGSAAGDEDFTGGSDHVRYRITLDETTGPLQISATLYYQPIAYRWAQNLGPYESEETNRFTSYFDSMSGNSSVRLASTVMRVEASHN